VLGIEPDADEDTVEEAYWRFAERYSDDAIKDLSPQELHRRCQELHERFGGRPPGADCRVRESPDDARDQIRRCFIAANGARDELLAACSRGRT
jgi:hypothetical protein